jgi:hypothetical protein
MFGGVYVPVKVSAVAVEPLPKKPDPEMLPFKSFNEADTGVV